MDTCKQKLLQVGKGSNDQERLAPHKLQLAKAEASLEETTKIQRKKLSALKSEKRALLKGVLLSFNVRDFILNTYFPLLK